MPKRTTDISIIKIATDPWLHELVGFDAKKWLSNNRNIALTNDRGDVVLLDKWNLPNHIYCGHYFFLSRGEEAKEAATEMLKEVFTGPYEIEVLVGLTPVDKRGAIRMNEYLGFNFQGKVETEIGPCEFVLLTKKEWENK